MAAIRQNQNQHRHQSPHPSRWHPLPPTKQRRRRSMPITITTLSRLIIVVLIISSLSVNNYNNIIAMANPFQANPKKTTPTNNKNGDPYLLLAQSIQSLINSSIDSQPQTTKTTTTKQYDTATIATALRSLSTSQTALKKIDGAAHEAYQRTHISSTNLASASKNINDHHDDTTAATATDKQSLGGLKVAGRMSRNAARVGCVADSLFAAELCDLIYIYYCYCLDADPDGGGNVDSQRRGIEEEVVVVEKNNGEEERDAKLSLGGEEGTLASSTGRIVVMNATIYSNDSIMHQEQQQQTPSSSTRRKNSRRRHTNDGNLAISILVIYEPFYKGGAGIGHGGVDDLCSARLLSALHGTNIMSHSEIMEDDDDSNTDNEQPNVDKKEQTPRGRYLVILSDHQCYNNNKNTNSHSSQSSSTTSSPSILTVQHGVKNNDLPSIISTLNEPPQRLALRSGLVTNEVASVCAPLYRMAGRVLETIGPVLMEKPVVLSERNVEADQIDEDDYDSKEEKEEEVNVKENKAKANKEEPTPKPKNVSNKPPAIHIVGHSLAGGVAALAANILDGSLPMPGSNKKSTGKRRKGAKSRENGIKSKDNEQDSAALETADPKKDADETSNSPPSFATTPSWSGFARARSSALCLGPPPCISPNLKSAFVTSIIHGDDIVCRTTHDTINHLCDRTRRSIQGGILGRSVGWMSDAVSLTVSGLKSHAHGSEGEEGKLSVPGKVYLIRPRRMGGGSSSIHEVGGATGGREALRAAVLWQLNDVLLSKSLWSHHGLDAYIRSLDRVQLRGFTDSGSSDERV